MLTGKTLADFCKLVLKVGVNLQNGQGLEIACAVDKHEVAYKMCEEAYKMGASMVKIRWSSQQIERLTYEYASKENLEEVPKWFIDSKNYLVEKGYCYVAIVSDDPDAFNGIPSEKIAVASKAKSKALKKFSDVVMSNGIRWCVVSVPSTSWAKKVFPNSKNAEEELSLAIESCMRLHEEDPVEAWERHVCLMEQRAKFLTEKNFEYVRFTNKLGTNLKVGLADDHVWISAKERALDGEFFVANLPTEEVFTAPHSKKVDGVLKSALPLCENGKIIDDFTITFKNGKIVDFDAKVGYDALKEIIETDSGTSRLGEIALIGKNSPIAKSGILFYNTLFDENASCHLAIGKGYPTTIKNGNLLTNKQLKEKGLNDSIEHVDFMIGTPDLNVVGIERNGKETLLFSDGEWVI